jgi:hypothetical protein
MRCSFTQGTNNRLSGEVATRCSKTRSGPDICTKADTPLLRIRAQDVDLDFSVTGDPHLCYYADRATNLWGILDTFFVRLPGLRDCAIAYCANLSSNDDAIQVALKT